MVIGVIDIGTNTTRLLVAEVEGGSLEPLLERRHFASPDSERQALGERLGALVEAEARQARELGARELVVVGTAALRDGADEGLRRACRSAADEELRVLSEREEAELAFLGATAGETSAGEVAVADVGGGSTQLAVGKGGGRPSWWVSRRLGSRILTQEAFGSDPPTEAELRRGGSMAAAMLDGLRPPPFEQALAVSGGAASLRRLCGETLDGETVRGTLDVLTAAPAEEKGIELGLAPERVRLMPAALLILAAIGELLGTGLRIARGGMREGLALVRAEELAAAGRRS